MTGFGRASHATEDLIARIETSSVNRKQCEVVVQLPRPYFELEPVIRQYALSQLSRGRIAISITLEHSASTSAPVRVDTAKAKGLSDALKQLSHEIGHPLDISTADILRCPDIISFEDNTVDLKAAKAAIMPALEEAIVKLISMRAREGEDLKRDTLMRLAILENETRAISDHAPAVLARYQTQLHRRLNESGLAIDLTDDRLLKEISIYAERCDISEEITRLHSHFAKFREYLDTGEPIGRSLDFLCQELNREFNTIGSKANDATLAQHVVHAKTELEKIREQVQNVE